MNNVDDKLTNLSWISLCPCSFCYNKTFLLCVLNESGSCQVSFGSELSNRGPTFDMDLSDFMEEGKPITYEKAKKYFAQDPSQKWVALCAFIIRIRHIWHSIGLI